MNIDFRLHVIGEQFSDIPGNSLYKFYLKFSFNFNSNDSQKKFSISLKTSLNQRSLLGVI